MIQIYRVFTTFLYPLLIIFLFYRKIIKKEHPSRFKEKIFKSYFNVVKKNDSKLIWFHAASIGEFKSILPIIKELNSCKRNLKFLITSTTLSSGNLAENELKKFSNVEHRYFPLDIPFLLDQFLSLWKPDNIFLVDSEIWPNLILNAKKFNIPIALINARLTSKSFKRWKAFPSTAKKIFSVFDLFICSNLQTKKNLENLNLKNVFFKGNIKLIGKIENNKIKNINENILLKKRFWIAASIHADEFDFCLKTHMKLKERYKDIITVIAPRHIGKLKNIYKLTKKYNLNVQVLESDETITKDKEIIIINYFGFLQNYFKYAKSVFIGKSTVKRIKDDSGQNPIEAAKLNCKIYHGPYVSNFKDIYNILENNNIAKKIKSFEELSESLMIDLSTPDKIYNEGFNLIKDLEQKTLNDTMLLVNNFIENENK